MSYTIYVICLALFRSPFRFLASPEELMKKLFHVLSPGIYNVFFFVRLTWNFHYVRKYILHSRNFPLEIKLFLSLRFIFHELKQHGIKYTVELCLCM